MSAVRSIVGGRWRNTGGNVHVRYRTPRLSAGILALAVSVAVAGSIATAAAAEAVTPGQTVAATGSAHGDGNALLQ
jgi:hypothetical protein